MTTETKPWEYQIPMPQTEKSALTAHNLRRQLFVAPQLQGRLLSRAVLYCTLCACISSVVHAAVRRWVGADAGWIEFFGPVFLTMLLTIPCVIFDAARLSNRIAGPMIRAQGMIRRVANGDAVPAIRLRAGDPWSEWMQEFNAMIARLQSRTETPRHGPEDGEGVEP